MKKLYKKLLKKNPFYYPLHNWKARRKQRKEFLTWEDKGKPAPPPHIVKQQALKSYAEKFGLHILVETGTYYGDMIEAMKNDFEQIYSIELSRELYEEAKWRFKDIEQIELIHGDSGIKLKDVVSKISQPTLFWLDGHYSSGKTARGDKDTPIYEELDHILNSPYKGHVIIIDDARCFGADHGYPSIKELSTFIKSRTPSVNIVVKDDSIRITPEEQLL